MLKQVHEQHAILVEVCVRCVVTRQWATSSRSSFNRPAVVVPGTACRAGRGRAPCWCFLHQSRAASFDCVQSLASADRSRQIARMPPVCTCTTPASVRTRRKPCSIQAIRHAVYRPAAREPRLPPAPSVEAASNRCRNLAPCRATGCDQYARLLIQRFAAARSAAAGGRSAGRLKIERRRRRRQLGCEAAADAH